MSENGTPDEFVLPPVALLRMMTGYWVSQAIYVAAKVGVADQITDGPRRVEELAEATKTDGPSLRRVLRALASAGIFTEARPGAYAHTPLSELLRSDASGSMRSLAIMYNEEQYRAWGDVLQSVRTGNVAFDQHFGMSYFSYLAQHPEADRVFNHAMTGWTVQLADAVVDAYDFSHFQTIVDVGGSYGTLLAATLRANPDARGILFDQPHVAAVAGEHLEHAGVADRCTTVGGDFFVEVPAHGEAYLLAQILHDWNDERSVEILRQCRRAIPSHGKLLVIELVLPEGEEPFFGKWLDLHMLVLLGARERTAAEYGALFDASGFVLECVIPTSAGASIVEAMPT